MDAGMDGQMQLGHGEESVGLGDIMRWVQMMVPAMAPEEKSENFADEENLKNVRSIFTIFVGSVLFVLKNEDVRINATVHVLSHSAGPFIHDLAQKVRALTEAPDWDTTDGSVRTQRLLDLDCIGRWIPQREDALQRCEEYWGSPFVFMLADALIMTTLDDNAQIEAQVKRVAGQIGTSGERVIQMIFGDYNPVTAFAEDRLTRGDIEDHCLSRLRGLAQVNGRVNLADPIAAAIMEIVTVIQDSIASFDREEALDVFRIGIGDECIAIFDSFKGMEEQELITMALSSPVAHKLIARLPTDMMPPSIQALLGGNMANLTMSPYRSS
jgi:hypothetical protein